MPEWLAEALEFADEAGDRSRQLGTLTTLAWHHFIRSLWGGAADTAEAEGFARRLAELAEELGAIDMAVHGRSLLAVMARFSGRLDEAAGAGRRCCRRLAGIVDDESYPWLGRAATFTVAVARGGADLAPPSPPVDSPDPVVGMALLVIEAALTLEGRVEEGLARLEVVDRPSVGPFGDLVEMLNGLALVLGGRAADALPWIERAVEAGRALEASARVRRGRRPGGGDHRGGGPASPGPASAVEHRPGALVLRAHARRGDAAALDALRRGRAAPGVAGPAPRAVERLAVRAGGSSAGRRLVPRKRLGIAVPDRERSPAVRTTDVDVLVRRLDVLGFERHRFSSRACIRASRAMSPP